VAREEARQETQRKHAKGVEELLGATSVQKLLHWSTAVEIIIGPQEVCMTCQPRSKVKQLKVLQWDVDKKVKEELGESELEFIITLAILDMVKNL
jgi:hypothetical protein